MNPAVLWSLRGPLMLELVSQAPVKLVIMHALTALTSHALACVPVAQATELGLLSVAKQFIMYTVPVFAVDWGKRVASAHEIIVYNVWQSIG